LKRTDGGEESVMTAVTFAEAGEWTTARGYLAPPRRRGLAGWLERHLAAAALAEEGLHDEALRLAAGGRPRPLPAPREDDPLEALDALLRERGVRMFRGVASPAALAARR
jgi:hypothetical protein